VRFRTLLLLLMIVPLAVVLASTVAGLGAVIRRATDRQITEDLGRSARIVSETLEHREVLLRSEAQMLADEPRLRALLGTEEVSDETMAGVLDELRTALHAETLVLIDADGHMVAGANARFAGDEITALMAIVASVGPRGEAVGYVRQSGRLLQVLVRRASRGATLMGTLVVGTTVDDALASSVHEKTGSAVIFTFDGTAVARSDVRDSRANAVAAMATTAVEDEVRDIDLEGARYRAAFVAGGSARAHPMHAVVLRSVDEARTTERKLLRLLYVIGAAALAAAFALALHVARRQSAPMDALVDVTREVMDGNLVASAELRGSHETRTLGRAINRMLAELARARDVLIAKERLERDLVLASRIQSALAPRAPTGCALQIAGETRPAAVVGGDYFDVIPTVDGSWIAIGDVAGHGLNAGLVTLMVQCAVASAARQAPSGTPSDVLATVNTVLHDNIRHRLCNDEHVTLTLLKHGRDGQVSFSGAHEDIIVWRAATGMCECIPTSGTWLGIVADIARVSTNETLRLERGDLLVLYTDGVTEARSADGKFFGLRRLCDVIEAHGAAEPADVRDRILAGVASFRSQQDDDETVVVFRQA
jgi:phosphoserine phosphatase RsbU/P